MKSVFRLQSLVRPTRLSALPVYQPSISHSWRRYAHSSYGGEGEVGQEQPPNSPTRKLEHPGPAEQNDRTLPNTTSTGVPSSSSTYQQPPKDPKEKDYDFNATPSNKAHPTITDGQASPNVDKQGNVRSDVPEDVKEHNEEMEHRAERSYNQIGDDGKTYVAK